MARGKDYSVVIPITVKDGTGSGSGAVRSSVDRMLKEQMRAIESANRAQAADAKRTATQIAQLEAQQARREVANRKATEKEKARAAEQSAREVQRINAQTARQAEQQMKAQERAAKNLADEKLRQIKREQSAFLQAEKEKLTALQRLQAAQKASADSTSAAWLTAFGAIKAVALAAFAAIVTAGAGLGLAISRAISFDVLERSLKVVAGTAEEAARQMVRLKELARLPGLGLRQAIEASIALQIGFQTAIKDTGKRLELTEGVIKQFSNAIALTGGGPEVFQRVITQLTQMSNAGKVLMTDLRPIIQAAPAIGQSLLKAFGTIDPKEINALGLSTEQFMNKWVAALSTLERAPETAANAWTNFTTAFDLALVKIGKPFLEPLTRALTVLEPLLERMGTRVSEIFTMIGEDAGKLWANLPEATRTAFAGMLGFVQSQGGQIVQWFQTNYPLMQAVVSNTLNQIAAFWNKYGLQIQTIVGQQLTSILTQTTVILQLLAGNWKDAFAKIPAIIRAEGDKGIQAIGLFLRLIWGAVLLQKDLIKKTGTAIGEALVDGIKEALERKGKEAIRSAAVLALNIAQAMRGSWQIQSPSKVFQKIGEQIVDGLIVGIEKRKPDFERSVLDLTVFAAAAFPDPDKPVVGKQTAKQIARTTAKAQWDAQHDALKKIREELTHQVEVLRELGGEETAVERINRLLSDPKVAARISERTKALLLFNAAVEDTRKGPGRERFANAQTRPRRFNEDLPFNDADRERPRRAGEGWEVDAAIAGAYADIIDDLNGKIGRNNELTQVQIVQQKLISEGLFDLNDARTQEALKLAAVIDQTEQLATMRERVRQVAGDISSVFARAVDDWSGSLGDFFRNIGRGFSDLLKRMIGDVVQSGLTNVFQQVLGRIFGGGTSTASGGGIFSRIFGGGSTATATTFPSGGGSLTGFLSASLAGSASGSSSPASLTSAPRSWADFAKLVPMNPGSANGFSMAGIKSGIGAMLPFLGLGVGASLGGGSMPGSILGGAGGLLAGGVGAAFLTPGLFAAGGAFGSMGPAIAGFLTNPFTIAAAGALIVGALILKTKQQRDKDEKTRALASQDTGTALFSILNAVRVDQMDGSTARSEIEKIHQQWIATGNAMKDSKTKRIHMETWSHFQPIIDGIEKEIGQQTTRGNNRARMMPVFASGGYSSRSQLIKVRPGEGMRYPGSSLVSRIEGPDRGYDSEYMFAPKGTQIIPNSEMRNAKPHMTGGIVGDSGGSNTPNILQIDSLEFNLDPDGLATVVIKSRHFKTATIHNVKVGKLEGKIG